MERNRACKICSRRFSNGKAMGGHMRSHFAKLPPRLPPATLAPSSPLSPSTQQQQQQQQHREKPRTSVPPDARDRVATVHDRGSDTESSPPRRRGELNRSRRRRRRRRRRDGSAARADASSDADVEQTISSVSETGTLSEADVALCLIMLSRDKWPRRARTDEADEHEDDGDGSVSVTQTDSRAGSSRPRYQCETCDRGFGSYQALGGHRASHKKMSDESHNHKRLAFQCPHCHKAFDSGQALGGHKKVHNEAITATAKKGKNCGESSIDLNLPAPEENGEEETTASLVEISSVSNEEALYPIKKGFLQV